MTLPWWTVALMGAGCLVGCVLGPIVCMLAWRLQKRLNMQASNAAKRLGRLDEQHKLLSTGAMGIGHRLLAVESTLKSMQHAPQYDSGDNENHAYSHALHMFEQGIDSDTVAASCGISQSEANLMALMHKQKHGQDAFAH